MLGFDISGWQKSVQWGSTGHSFVYIKATEGVGYVNPWLDGQHSGAVDSHLTWGFYHYANPHNDPSDDARSFADVVKQYDADAPGCLPPCLDFETSVGDPNAWIYSFITTLWSELALPERPQTKVILYSSASWFSTGYLHTDWAPSVALWVASWNRPPGHPSYLTPRVALHQYTANGTVPGVSGSVDLDYSIWPLSQVVIST
jgi:GH25 family lysozyme M1 (1,4-beta-N-acetylmuramidase)